MGKRPLRVQCTGDIFMVSNRCFQNAHNLPTDPSSNELIVGAMGRFARKRDIGLLAYTFLPNGFWIILSAQEANMQNFMRDFQSWLALWCNKTLDRDGRFFHDRYEDDPIADQEALREAWIDLVVAPVREGFAFDLDAYEGLTSWKSRVRGEPAEGRWVDRGRLRSLRRSDPDLSEEAVTLAEYLECVEVSIGDLVADGGQLLGARAWIEEAVEERVAEILDWQDEVGADEVADRRATPHPAPWCADPIEPIGPPKYRWRVGCRATSRESRERYRAMRREVREEYSTAMRWWRGAPTAEDTRLPRGVGDAGGDASMLLPRAASVFPQSSIPPGWVRTRRPLRRSPALGPPDPLRNVS